MERLKEVPFVLLGVNSDRDREQILTKCRDENLSWRSFWNGPEGTRGPIARQWNIRGWPTIFVIDSEGVIQHKQLGGDASKLDAAITDVLNKMGHAVDLSKASDELGDE
ncbi:MAG: hypothetical protein KDA60_02775 [Planctomycetales bacterium]|nr:hypothetical protein [Planctomycetales bacterium]